MSRLHESTVGDWAAEHRRSRPAALALVCGRHRVSWQALDDRVNRLARTLLEWGVGPGERVLWLGENCHLALELFLAAARIEVMFCAASTRDTAHENAFIVDDLEPRVVFWTNRSREHARQIRELSRTRTRWVNADPAPGSDYETVLGTADPTEVDVAVDPAAALLVFYTAAYDGRPNGAMLSHRAIITQDYIFAMAYGYDRTSVYLNSAPFGYLGVWQGTLPTLHFGGTNVLLAEVDPEEICTVISKERVTRAFLAGATVRRIVELNRAGRFDLSSLGTAPQSPEWDAMVTPDASLNPMGHGLGLTEVMGLGAAQCFGGSPQQGRPGRGWSTPAVVMRVLDENGREVPDGVRGVLAMRGPVVMNGYWNRPELNAEVLYHGWFHFHHCYVRRAVDGSVAYAGVRQRVIRSGGENIYPAEVERVVRQLPAVAECAVLGRPDPIWGQAVAAVVVLRPGPPLTEATVIEHCREYLASFRKPRWVVFAAELPRTADGAVDYARLDEQYGGGGYPGLDQEPG